MSCPDRLHSETLAREGPAREADVEPDRQVNAVTTERERQVVRHAECFEFRVDPLDAPSSPWKNPPCSRCMSGLDYR